MNIKEEKAFTLFRSRRLNRHHNHCVAKLCTNFHPDKIDREIQ